MRRIREVLRLKYECGLSHRSISASTGMSKGSVHDYLRRADEAGMTWERARELDDAAVESQLFTAVGRSEPPERAPIDLEWVRREMRKTGVTLQLVWSEYRDHVLADGGERRPYQSIPHVAQAWSYGRERRSKPRRSDRTQVRLVRSALNQGCSVATTGSSSAPGARGGARR